MKRLTLVLLAVFAVVLSIDAQEVPPNTAPAATAKGGSIIQKLNGHQEKDSTKQNSSQGSPEPSCTEFFNSYPIYQQHTKTKEEESKEASLDRLYRGYLLATIIGVAGAWIGVVVLICQTISTRIAADAANASAEAVRNGERAWILVDKFSELEKIYFDNPDWFLTFVYGFKVFGKTPARVIECAVRFHLVGSRKNNSRIEADLPIPPDYGPKDKRPDLPGMGSILAPQREFSIVVLLESLRLTAEDWEDIKFRRKFLCTYGFVRYQDAFDPDTVRETRFCYIYDFQPGGVLVSPETGKQVRLDTFRANGPVKYNNAT